MINYLPQIYPDELVYSLFCRYFVHSGCLTHKIALEELYQKRHHNPSKEFIGHLNPNAQKRIEEIYTMDRLILEHTMFPQYARFIPTQDKKKAIYHLRDNFCDPHHIFPILPRTKNDIYLKYCPICAIEDREKYGETYWHRKHQIRNMKSCYKHRCMLESSDISVKSEQCYTFSPAEEYVKPTVPVIANNEVQNFSEFIASVFDSNIDFENDIPINTVLHYGLVGSKYLSKTGNTKYTKKLSEDLQAFYSKIGLTEIASLSQIQRLWFGRCFDFSVICQIAYFIGMTAEDLTQPELSSKQIEAEQRTHYILQRPSIEWDKLDNEIAPGLEKFAKNIYNGTANIMGRPSRVSEKMVYTEFKLEKHRLKQMPKCRAILESYSEPYEKCWARRIIWAYNKLKLEGLPFYRSDIYKLSGVKKKNIEKVIPYIYKHTNNTTADAIVNMIHI